MRGFLFLLPAAMLAQTPAPKPVTPAPKPAAPAAAKPVATPKPAAPKPAATPKPAAPKPAAVKPAAPKPFVFNTDDEKIIYSLGLSIAKSLGQFQLTPAEIEIVKRALSDNAVGKPAIDINEFGPKIQAFAQSRADQASTKEKAAGVAYVQKAAEEPGASKYPAGFVYKELSPGTGPTPKATDTVKVHYRGTLIDGTEFDSSYKRNEPAQFPLTGVIRCWTEGVQLIKVGGKGRLVCPSDVAYGDRGRPPTIPGGAVLIFEIELLEIVAPPAPAK